MRLFMIAGALVLAGVMAGCGGSPEDTPATGSETAQPETAEPVEVTPDQVVVSQGAGAGLPEDVPTYPDATIDASASIAIQDAHSLSQSTSDPLPKVEAYFKTQLEQGGWKSQITVSQPAGSGMAVLNYTKDGRMINVTLGETDKGTAINIAVASI